MKPWLKASISRSREMDKKLERDAMVGLEEAWDVAEEEAVSSDRQIDTTQRPFGDGFIHNDVKLT